MATKTEIRAASKMTDSWLLAKQKLHTNMVQNSIKGLQKDILNSLNILKMSPTGRIDGIKVNLGTAQKLQKRVEELFYSDFNNHTKKIVRDFKTASAAIENSFTMIGEASKFTNVDKTMMSVLRDGYYADYLAIGETAKNKVVQSVYDNVIGNGQFTDLVDEISGALVGAAAVGVTGRSLAQYSRLYARDMIMNYHNEVMLKKAEDIGMDVFLYTGTLMAKSRDFCKRRVGNPYTKKQIESWKFRWQGKSGPALTSRGGYNCRHHWQPVRKRWLDDKELTMLDKEWRLDKDGKPMTGLSSTAKRRTAKKAAKAKRAAALAEKRKIAAAKAKAEDEAIEKQLQALEDAARKKRLAEEAGSITKADDIKLTARQKNSIKVSDVNKITDKTITNIQKWTLEKKGIKLSKTAVKKWAKAFENQIPFHMNRGLRKGSASYKDLMENGSFKNQFQLGANATSGGAKGPFKGSNRDNWEMNITKGILQTNPKYKKLEGGGYMNLGGIANERPMYGYISDPLQYSGAKIGGSYGDVTFVLKDNVRTRSTLFTSNTSGFMENIDSISSPKNNRILLRNMIDNGELSDADFKKMVAGKKPSAGFTNSVYTESQVYGGVDLRRDIKEVIVDKDTPHIRDLAEKWGIKYIVEK